MRAEKAKLKLAEKKKRAAERRKPVLIELQGLKIDTAKFTILKEDVKMLDMIGQGLCPRSLLLLVSPSRSYILLLLFFRRWRSECLFCGVGTHHSVL